MKNFLLLVGLVLLSGCQSTGVIPLSADTYMVSKTSAGGIFTDMAGLKAEVIREANAFAESKGKVAVALVSKETPPGPGRMPSFEYQFRLLERDDPRAQGAALTSRADIVVESK